MGELNGKVALVTGGGSGIGEACSRALAERGARVVIADINEAGARRVAAEVEGSTWVVADVTSSASVASMVATTIERLGRLDIAVNNAGLAPVTPAPTAEQTDESWTLIRSILLDGVFYCMRSEIGQMVAQGGGGSIINMSSIYGAVACPGQATYAAAKHGVVGLTQTAAVEYAADAIRVNAVAPGYVRTPQLERNLNEEQRAAAEASQPLGRLGRPEEVADLVCYLASDAAGFVTGSFFPIDGGFLAQ